MENYLQNSSPVGDCQLPSLSTETINKLFTFSSGAAGSNDARTVSSFVGDCQLPSLSTETLNKCMEIPSGATGSIDASPRGLKRKLEDGEVQSSPMKRNKTLKDFDNLSTLDITRLLEDAELLGSGTYGHAYKTTYKGKAAVLKVPTSTGKLARRNIIEASLMIQADGAGGAPRLLATSEESMAVLMELRPGLDYFEVLNNRSVPVHCAVAALPEIAKQLDEIHKKGISHNDLKADNILFNVNQKGEVVVSIIDFGLSCPISQFIKIGHAGKKSFYAPEYAEGAKAAPAGDVYSLGFLISQVASHLFTPPNRDLEEIARLAQDLDPQNRPTMIQMYWLLKEALGDGVLRHR